MKWFCIHIVLLIASTLPAINTVFATDSLVIRGEAFIALSKTTYDNLNSITSPYTPYVLTSVSSLTALCDSAGITELTQMFPRIPRNGLR